MTSKWDVVAALKRSGLLTSDRIIVMMLVDVADADTAIVPERFTPSLTELAEWTGLGRATVSTRLKELERLGWVKRDRPATADALGRGDRTCYHLAIGQAVEKSKPKRPGGGRHGKHGSAAEPVQPLNHDSDEVVQPLNQGGSTAEPPLVQPLNRPSSAAEHKEQPPTGVVPPTSSHQDPPGPPASPPPATDAATLPGFETTEQAPPPSKPKRKRTTKPKTREPTHGQRVNRLAKRYTDIVKLSPFHAVRSVVDAAVKTGEYTDEQIGAGLDRLAKQRLTVTANTLRIAIEGDQQRARSPDWRDTSGQDHDAWTKGHHR